MQNSLILLIVVLVAPCVLGDGSYNSIDRRYNSYGGRGNTIKCISGSDCSPDECSVMGMQRYAEPECRPRGQLGDSCRMYADEPENKTLHFPHVTMECQDVYMQFCPCALGLVCREAECQPEQPEAELELEEDETSYGSNLAQNQIRRPFPWALGRFH